MELCHLYFYPGVAILFTTFFIIYLVEVDAQISKIHQQLATKKVFLVGDWERFSESWPVFWRKKTWLFSGGAHTFLLEEKIILGMSGKLGVQKNPMMYILATLILSS